jgi:GT2 family glycosyltransferase
MIISFVIPSYNNLRYLKHAYTSVRKYAGPLHEIIVLDDSSTDGTVEWLKTLADENLVIWENPTGRRLGHTVTYNIGGKLAKNEVFGILHADMYIGPNYIENAVKHLKPGVVVSSTRIEPPLHPGGKEKLQQDFGMWPETFKEPEFLQYVALEQSKEKDKTTGGIFAPWMMYKEDFLRIGGHDLVFAPFPFEDSDIFRRFMMAGYEVVQSRDSLVYHLTCRGHKWTDDTVIGKVDNEYPMFETRARRNYIRKWNSWIANDEYLRPLFSDKYKLCIVLYNSVDSVIPELELWSDKLYTDIDIQKIQQYISVEQKNTLYNLNERIAPINEFSSGQFPVELHIDCAVMTNEDWNMLLKVQDILGTLSSEESPAGTYELGNIKVVVHELKSITQELIHTTPIENTIEYLSIPL